MEKSVKTWKIDGEVWLHCPVCGHDVIDYDICDTCNWQNTGIVNIDGGPNKMTLVEAREAYAKGLRKDLNKVYLQKKPWWKR